MKISPIIPRVSPQPVNPSHGAAASESIQTDPPSPSSSGAVQISKEGLARLRSGSPENETESADTNASPGAAQLDKLIEHLQEKIQALKEQIQALEGDSSEGADRQKEALQLQLTQLLGALQDAFNEKFKLMEKALAG